MKWSEDKFQVASFKAEQVVNDEAENANQARFYESGVISDQMENIFSYTERRCHEASSNNGRC